MLNLEQIRKTLEAYEISVLLNLYWLNIIIMLENEFIVICK